VEPNEPRCRYTRSIKQTPYDQFNFEIPQGFSEQGVSAAANAIVNSGTWTDTDPMLNFFVRNDLL
jgi:hypothetical protein